MSGAEAGSGKMGESCHPKTHHHPLPWPPASCFLGTVTSLFSIQGRGSLSGLEDTRSSGLVFHPYFIFLLFLMAKNLIFVFYSPNSEFLIQYLDGD